MRVLVREKALKKQFSFVYKKFLLRIGVWERGAPDPVRVLGLDLV